MSPFAALIFALLFARFSLSGPPQALAEAGAHPFAVDFPAKLDLAKLQARYFIAGDFGGEGEFVFEKPGEHRILLHTAVKGSPATCLKAILYVPGCQLATIDVPDLAESPREFNFECRPLPTIPFTGRIGSAETITDPRPVVAVEYMAFWAHSFFGIQDGIVTTFQIATVPLGAGAVFKAALPDFSQDAVTQSHDTDLRKAKLSFMLRDATTWNILGRLDDLPIQSVYPPEVGFSLRKQ
jgi:hypothetical protein